MKKKVRCEPRRVGIEAHLEKNRELGTGAGRPLSECEAHQGSRPDVVEEWKWMAAPVWSHDGIICTGESYKKVVKLTFAKGASLERSGRLFNSSLDGNVRRAIDIPKEKKSESPLQGARRQAVASTVLASRNLRRSEVLRMVPESVAQRGKYRQSAYYSFAPWRRLANPHNKGNHIMEHNHDQRVVRPSY